MGSESCIYFDFYFSILLKNKDDVMIPNYEKILFVHVCENIIFTPQMLSLWFKIKFFSHFDEILPYKAYYNIAMS